MSPLIVRVPFIYHIPAVIDMQLLLPLLQSGPLANEWQSHILGVKVLPSVMAGVQNSVPSGWQVLLPAL